MSTRAGWIGNGAGPSDLFAGAPVAVEPRRILDPVEHQREILALAAELERVEQRAAARVERAEREQAASRRDEIESMAAVGIIEPHSWAETVGRAFALGDLDDVREERRRARELAEEPPRRPSALEYALANTWADNFHLRQQAQARARGPRR